MMRIPGLYPVKPCCIETKNVTLNGIVQEPVLSRAGRKSMGWLAGGLFSPAEARRSQPGRLKTENRRLPLQ
jgi:hypothetical protein